MAKFNIIGSVLDREKIAEGRGIRDRKRLQHAYGGRRWIKCKGRAKVSFADGAIYDAEIHWYEAQGIGRREEKIVKVIR